MPQVVVLTTLLFSLAYLASTNLALQNLRVETHWKTLLPQAVNGERLWIMTSLYLAPDDQERLRSEIINVIAFVADMSLEKSQVRFVSLNQLQSHAEGQDDPEMRAQVVVMAFNAAGSQQEGYKILDEAALTELCKPDFVSWSSSSQVTHHRPPVLAVRVTDRCSQCMQNVLLGWVRRDLTSSASGGASVKQSIQFDSMMAAANGAKEHVVQCNSLHRHATLTILYPPLLSTFFGDKVTSH